MSFSEQFPREIYFPVQYTQYTAQERQDAFRAATYHVLTQVPKCTVVDGGIFENVLYQVNSTNFVT
jgi:hypothetical protein